MTFRPASWLALIPVVSVAVAQAEFPVDAARDCGRIAADDERLACYDALFRSQATSVAATPGPAQEFGLTEAELADRRRQSGEPTMPDEITSRVVGVTMRLHSPPVLELENGQRWRLLEISNSPQFRIGDSVTVRRGALGSYLASAAERKRAWRVRRVD